MVGREGKEGGSSWHDGCRVACCFASDTWDEVGCGMLWLLWMALSVAVWCALPLWRFVVGWVRSGLSEPSTPIICPRRMWMDGIGLAGRNGLGPLVLLFLWSSGPHLLWHPTSYWTAALFSDNSSLMFLDDRPLMPSLRLFNVMQLLDNQGVGGSIQCRHHVKSKSHARQPGCLAVNCP